MEVTVTLPQESYGVKEGLERVTVYMKSNDIVRRTGISSQIISYGRVGLKNGRRYRMSDENVDKINRAIQEVGNELIHMRLSYDDTLSQIKELTKTIDTRHLFMERMGFSESKMRNLIINRHTHVYGRFRPEVVDRLNRELFLMGLELVTKHIAYERG